MGSKSMSDQAPSRSLAARARRSRAESSGIGVPFSAQTLSVARKASVRGKEESQRSRRKASSTLASSDDIEDREQQPSDEPDGGRTWPEICVQEGARCESQRGEST